MKVVVVGNTACSSRWTVGIIWYQIVSIPKKDMHYIVLHLGSQIEN
jgi:hypothetical protein